MHLGLLVKFLKRDLMNNDIGENLFLGKSLQHFTFHLTLNILFYYRVFLIS